MDDPREFRLHPPPTSPPPPSSYCQECGAKAATKQVEFYQIIGAVIVFHFKAGGGQLCKSCVHEHFWNYTLVSLCLGWWSCLSFLLTPFVLLHNIVRYVFCLGMPRPPKEQAVTPAPTMKAEPKGPAAAEKPWWSAWS
jgi:hypothetical protein